MSLKSELLKEWKLKLGALDDSLAEEGICKYIRVGRQDDYSFRMR